MDLLQCIFLKALQQAEGLINRPASSATISSTGSLAIVGLVQM